jgi:O-antigen ligase
VQDVQHAKLTVWGHGQSLYHSGIRESARAVEFCYRAGRGAEGVLPRRLPAATSRTAVFALPGLVLLVVFDYFKPQEYVPALASVPLLYVFTALTVGGFLLDLRIGLARLSPAPQLTLTLMLFAWALVTAVPHGFAVVVKSGFALLVPITLFLLVAHAVQTFRAFQALACLMLVISLALAFVGVHQGLAPWGCHRIEYRALERRAVFDGRACPEGDRQECAVGAEPGVSYVCERVGLLGTSSAGGGRVRFRGTIEDPNELAIAVCMAIPIAFALFDRRRTAPRFALLATSIALAGICAVWTRSRGGQLVFAAVLGVYFVRRFGFRGLLGGGVCALPILLLGGRDTADAAASSSERVELLYRGVEMFRASPFLGVGLGRFTEHAPLTAHNSFVLAAAELGLLGMLLWSAVLYLSLKIPLQALRSRGSEPPAMPPVAITWSLAVLAALAGISVGMMFLSYAYKEVLWAFIGVSGALYQAIRRHDPSFRVRLGLRDLAIVAAADVGLLAALAVFTRVKLGS